MNKSLDIKNYFPKINIIEYFNHIFKGFYSTLYRDMVVLNAIIIICSIIFQSNLIENYNFR